MESYEYLRSLSTQERENLSVIKGSLNRTEKMPFIDYQVDKNILVIKSKDISHISFAAYESIARILRLHFHRSTQLVMYIFVGDGQIHNKSRLEMLFREINQYKNEGAKVEITWFYPEDRVDMESIGRYIKTKYRIQLTTIPA